MEKIIIVEKRAVIAEEILKVVKNRELQGRSSENQCRCFPVL